MREQIKALTLKYSNDVIQHYRHLHAHPELSFEEFLTAQYIQDQLTEMQIPFRSGIGGNGILGRIEGVHPQKKVIALRADMDALPIDEVLIFPGSRKTKP